MIKVIDNFLTKEDCDSLIRDNLSNLESIREPSYERRCLSKFIELPKIKFKLTDIVNETRKGLTIDPSFEFIQYSKNDHFEWHHDVQLNNPKVHYITSVIILNDDFKGGELVFRENLKIFKPPIRKGSLIIFSSKIKHKVNKITEGKRYSLCCWFYKDTSKVKTIL